MSLLEIIYSLTGCYYLSDLHFQPYNKIAKHIFETLNLKRFTQKEIKDTYNYIFE